jgi:hypothetical protein
VASLTGQSNFALPQASLDFVGTWSGAVPLIASRPPGFGSVVMSVATYAAAGIKVLRISAMGLDNRHVLLEQDLAGSDTLGRPLWEHDRVEIGLVSPSQLECTKTSKFYRDASRTVSVAEVVYHGPLARISEAERTREIREIERKGMTKQAETQAPISKR